MQTLQNSLTLDYENNPELKDYCSTLKVGDKVSLTVEFQVNDLNDKNMVGTIESIEPSGYENPSPKEGESEGEIKPTPSAPVLMALGQKLSQAAD